MGIQNRRNYDPEFKRNAVLLTEEPERRVSEVAEKFVVKPLCNQLALDKALLQSSS